MNGADPARRGSAAGRLARLGFTDVDAGCARLDEAGLRLDTDHEPIAALAGTADPDLALNSLVRLTRAAGTGRAELLAALRGEAQLRMRLFSVLGASIALGEHLEQHPDDWRSLRGEGPAPPTPREVRAEFLHAVGAAAEADEPRATTDSTAALYAAYRHRIMQLAARDLTGAAGFDEVAAELADLAAALLEAGLALGRAELLPDDAAPCRLAVVGMGKCGGRELNYASDVDVIFVAEPAPGTDDVAALESATKLASALVRICADADARTTPWRLDAALRPEGKAGPLVRTLDSHLAYYRRWAKTWEFQALLKARPLAGDWRLGVDYVAAVSPLVWEAAGRENFVADVQAMRRRVEAGVPADQVSRQLKLGPGGLRDVEFAVQLLQLVHGRTDPALRVPGTLEALRALSDGGYVGRDDAVELADGYRFLRRTEHLLQLYRLRRTHLVPDDRAGLRRLGRVLCAGEAGPPEDAFVARWRRHARGVRRLHEKLFYRPLLDAVADLSGGEARLTPRAARVRLEALGYADPAGALRHIEALTSGLSRRAAIQRTLLPVLLGWFADAADPDAGLLGFRRVSDALGSSPWYLRLLRDDVDVAARLVRILASGPYAPELLMRDPATVALLRDEDELGPRPAAGLREEMANAAGRHDDARSAILAVRSLRRRELFRVAAADLLGRLEVDTVGEALTDINAAAIDASLSALITEWERDSGTQFPALLCVIAMGRFGGHELGYGSDADVLFVHDPRPGGDAGSGEAARSIVERLRQSLAQAAADPALTLDADLRPEGRQGPLVRTLASYRAYYGRWSSPWESQALIRAEPVAGDARLCTAFVEVIDLLRWPAGGLSAESVREIRRLKARMEAERLPRGADPATHTKLGPGGLSDVEWTVQLLQLQHGHAVAGLRTTRTLAALRAAADAGLIDAADARRLAEAWRLASRLRAGIMLTRGRPSDSLPTDPRERTKLARVLGYSADEPMDLVEDYLRAARRARAVTERVFYGAA